MAEFQWDVQPYQYVPELVNRYTSTIMSTTIMKYKERAAEIEQWMKENAPWDDRTPEMRALAAKHGAVVPARHARTALSARLHTDPNAQRYYEGMRRRAFAADIKKLSSINKWREFQNLSRPKSRQFKMLASLPKSKQKGATIEQEIRVLRGPIAELRFSHGKDIWYGVWLEIARQGRYSIIDKTIAHWSDILMGDIRQIANLQQFNITFSDTVVTEQEIFESFVKEQNEIFEFNESDKRYEPWTSAKAAQVRARRKRENRRQRALIRKEKLEAEESVAPLRKELAEELKPKTVTQEVRTYNPKTGKTKIIRR